jgi:hypothetical protein
VRQRYILGGSPVLIRALVEVVSTDPNMELVSVSGPASAPERIVAQMEPEEADLLRRALAGHLVIEPDELLTPFD